jgi:V8-like Glu-specific endopeptidase
MALAGLVPAVASDFPFIAYIETSFPNPTRGPGGLEIGTGTLIAPRLILTAGHIVYDAQQGGKAVSIDVRFGGSEALTFPRLTEVDFPVEWRQPRSSLDNSLVSPVDIGVIVLPEPIDRFVRPVPFQTASDTMLAGMSLNVGGYPAVPPQGARGTLWGRNFGLLQGASVLGDFARYESFRLFYPVATLGGMSGGPVYDFDPASQARTLRGIHTSFVDGFAASALRITEGIFQLIQQWVMTFRP